MTRNNIFFYIIHVYVCICVCIYIDLLQCSGWRLNYTTRIPLPAYIDLFDKAAVLIEHVLDPSRSMEDGEEPYHQLITGNGLCMLYSIKPKPPVLGTPQLYVLLSRTPRCTCLFWVW